MDRDFSDSVVASSQEKFVIHCPLIPFGFGCFNSLRCYVQCSCQVSQFFIRLSSAFRPEGNMCVCRAGSKIYMCFSL